MLVHILQTYLWRFNRWQKLKNQRRSGDYLVSANERHRATPTGDADAEARTRGSDDPNNPGRRRA